MLSKSHFQEDGIFAHVVKLEDGEDVVVTPKAKKLATKAAWFMSMEPTRAILLHLILSPNHRVPMEFDV